MSDTVLQQPIQTFLDTLASSAPTPGGGSVAALNGAMAAGLITMVCDLTIGKKPYAEFESEAQAIRETAEEQRAAMQRLVQEDIAVFERLSAAYKLPRVTQADAATRRAAIQQVTKLATEVPLQTARSAVGLLQLCAPLARHGNRSLVSDVGVAALLLRATVPAALMNVEINLAALEDKLYVTEARAHAQDLTIGLDEEVEGVLAIVRERMAT